MAILIFSIVFTGCDAINETFDSVFLTTPEVKAADLATYTGDVVTSEDDVMQGFGMVMGAMSDLNPAARILGDDYDEVMRLLDYSAPVIALVLGADESSSRTATVGANASISDETVTLDNGVKITVNEFTVTGNAESDSIYEPTEVQSDITAKAELEFQDLDVFEYDYVLYEDVLVATVEDLIFNLNAKANATTALDSSRAPTSVDYYAALDLSFGFSLSCIDPDASYAGKYVVNFNYVQSDVLTASEMENGDIFPADYVFSVTITVYSNTGSVLETVTLTEDDIM